MRILFTYLGFSARLSNKDDEKSPSSPSRGRPKAAAWREEQQKFELRLQCSQVATQQVGQGAAHGAEVLTGHDEVVGVGAEVAGHE